MKERRDFHSKSVLSEAGALGAVLACLVFIVLVVGVVIAFVLGLDRVYYEQTSKSLFHKDSGIAEIRAKIRSNSNAAATESAEQPAAAEQRAAPEQRSVPEQPAASERTEAKSVEQRLDDVHERIKNGAR